ncbi:hypothetical protein Tco_1192619 [Tanacetum coccineum]
MKTPSIATYKIFKQGEKGAYQIVREDGTDVVYINFGAMLKVISRDDLTELYRIVMNRYGMDGPEDELEKIRNYKEESQMKIAKNVKNDGKASWIAEELVATKIQREDLKCCRSRTTDEFNLQHPQTLKVLK